MNDRDGVKALFFKPHPWHGIPIGDRAPDVVTAYIEIVPTDTIKYEIDKATGYLMVDRPQLYSNICPTLYGLIPQTYCAEQVAGVAARRTGREDLVGDRDPLDICVLAEKSFLHGDFILKAVPIGGFRMLDGREADDKIIAVLEGDGVYGAWKDVSEVPESLVERLRHYFLTYKEAPEAVSRATEITHLYGAEEARSVIERSHEDYRAHLSELVRTGP